MKICHRIAVNKDPEQLGRERQRKRPQTTHRTQRRWCSFIIIIIIIILTFLHIFYHFEISGKFPCKVL